MSVPRPIPTYTHSFELPWERPRVFELFSDPQRLDRLTPQWFRLRPLGDATVELEEGTEIAYDLRYRGLPLRWTSRITDWQAPDFFAYEQRHGPYLRFRHEHIFESFAGGTRVRDTARYRAPGGRLVEGLIVRPELRRIFAYRERMAWREMLALTKPTRVT